MTVELSGYGKYLGTEKFDFTIKKGKGKNYIKPFHSIDEIRLSSGNSVSRQGDIFSHENHPPGAIVSQFPSR